MTLCRSRKRQSELRLVLIRRLCITMAKGQKPADQMEAFSKDAMAQAHQAIDTYFDFLKKLVSASGNNSGLLPRILGVALMCARRKRYTRKKRTTW